MKPAADIVRLLLLQLGYGEENQSSNWAVFVGFVPDDPDNAIVVFDTAGMPDGRLMTTGERIEHPGIQIRVRGLEYAVTRNRAEAIALALDAQHNAEIDLDEESVSASYIVQNITRTGMIMPLGAEESDRRRFHFTINAILTLRKVD